MIEITREMLVCKVYYNMVTVFTLKRGNVSAERGRDLLPPIIPRAAERRVEVTPPRLFFLIPWELSPLVSRSEPWKGLAQTVGGGESLSGIMAFANACYT